MTFKELFYDRVEITRGKEVWIPIWFRPMAIIRGRMYQVRLWAAKCVMGDFLASCLAVECSGCHKMNFVFSPDPKANP